MNECSFFLSPSLQFCERRYKSPESNYYHRMVWGHVSSRFVEPYLLRFVPQLRGPLGAVQQFFLK